MPRIGAGQVFIAALMLVGGLGAPPSEAIAATKSFSHPINAVLPSGGAVAGTSIALPATGNPSFFMTFVLPKDYQNDSTITVVVYLQSPADVRCNARIVAPQLLRKRIGSPLASSTDGISELPTIALSPGAMVAGKRIQIGPGGAMPGQRKSDGMTLQIRREADDPSDTCSTSVFVHGIDVRYEVP